MQKREYVFFIEILDAKKIPNDQGSEFENIFCF